MSALKGLPTSILAKIPIATPPLGTASNFVDPPNSETKFIIYEGVLLLIMVIFFAIRIFSRFRIIRRPTLDDREDNIISKSYYLLIIR